MSGIAGVVSLDGAPISETLLDAMAAASAARGIDGVRRWNDGTAGLIRFRHVTTPEAEHERQPLAAPGGDDVLCFDGRIDNRSELIGFLGLGSASAQLSDCALVAQLFARCGEALVERLVGDWAFAVWQPGPRRLFCACSPMGWRPFVWTLDRGRFAFATEAVTLIVGLGMARRPNEAMIAELLAGRVVTESETLWADIRRLPQGSALVLENGRVREWQWFCGPFPDQSELSEQALVERFRELFDQSVAACARSNTIVAAQLSGGLDSSSVVSRAVALQRAGRIDRPVTAFSARFPGEAQDETRWSSAVEAKLGIKARVMAAELYDFAAAERWAAETLQLPVRPNMFDVVVPTLRAAGAEGIRVVMTGEGGDEWLAGWLGHFPDFVRAGDLAGLWRETRLQFPEAHWIKRLRYAAMYGVQPLVSARYRAAFLRPLAKPGLGFPPWIRADWARAVGLRDRWIEAAGEPDLPSFAQRQRYWVYSDPMRQFAFEGILAMSERLGVEVRHPIHDLRLTRFVMGVPGGMLRRSGLRKYLLREAMRGSLPELVRNRRDKTRFSSAVANMIHQRFNEHPPEAMRLVRFGWIDPRAVRAQLDMLSVWLTDPERAASPDLGRLWFMIAVEIWLEHAARV